MLYKPGGHYARRPFFRCLYTSVYIRYMCYYKSLQRKENEFQTKSYFLSQTRSSQNNMFITHKSQVTRRYESTAVSFKRKANYLGYTFILSSSY